MRSGGGSRQQPRQQVLLSTGSTACASDIVSSAKAPNAPPGEKAAAEVLAAHVADLASFLSASITPRPTLAAMASSTGSATSLPRSTVARSVGCTLLYAGRWGAL